MEYKIITDPAFSQPVTMKAPTGFTANGWDEESKQSTIWANPKRNINTGIALNLDEITQQMNSYIAKHPFEILGGDDIGDDWFKIKATLKSVSLSLPERGGSKNLRIEAVINGGLEFSQGSYTMDVSLYAETGIDVLRIEEIDQNYARIFSIVLDGTQLGWAGAGWLPSVPLGLIVRIGEYMGADICSKLVLKSFKMAKQYDGVPLPLPSANELFLSGYAHNCLVLLYAQNKSDAYTSGLRLGQWANQRKSLLSLALEANYLYDKTSKLLYEYVNQNVSAKKIEVKVVPIETRSTEGNELQKLKIQLNGEDFNVEGHTFNEVEMNLYMGFDANGNLTVRARISGEYSGVSFDTAITITISADPPKDGVQQIRISPHVDFADIELPWWLKLLGFFTGGIAALVLIWVIEHIGDVAKAFINAYGTMSVPNTFAQYAHLKDIGQSNPQFESWIGANLMPGHIQQSQTTEPIPELDSFFKM